MNFDFTEALEDLVQAVKNVLQEMAKAFSELVETLTKDSVYYQYIHSSAREESQSTTAVINRGGVARSVQQQAVAQVNRIQSKELSRPTYNHQS